MAMLDSIEITVSFGDAVALTGLSDLLEIASTVEVSGRAKLRFEVQILHADSRKPVVRGYTVHAFANRQGKPIRPPDWFIEMITRAGSTSETTKA